MRHRMWWANNTSPAGTSAVITTSTRCKDTAQSACQLKNLTPKIDKNIVTSPVINTKKSAAKVTRSNKQKSRRQCSSSSTAISSDRVVLRIIGLYILCLLPGNLMNIYHMLDALRVLPASITSDRIFERDDFLSIYLYTCLIFSTLLYTMNSCVNPYIYYLRSWQQFRSLWTRYVSLFRRYFSRAH